MNQKKFFDTLIFLRNSILYREEHLARTHRTFQYLQMDVTPTQIEAWYQNFENRFLPESEGRIFKLTFDGPTEPAVTSRSLERLKTVDLTVLHDFSYTDEDSRFKWLDRSHWEAYQHLMPESNQDVLAVKKDGYIVECSRFNVFIFDKARDEMCTPPDESGCLDGVLRRHMLRRGLIYVPVLGEKKLVAAPVHVDDLKNKMLFVGNSVRGILPVTYSDKTV